MESGRGLTRREFDEVIRRAAELAASEPEGCEGGLTEAELFRIAGEVGLEERHVRNALTQIRSAPPSRGPVAAVFGPAHLSVSRVVPGTKEHLARVLDEFLVAGRLLQPVRRGGSVLHYRPAVDWASQIARAASATSRRYYVAAAKKVEIRMEGTGDNATRVEIEVEPGTRDDYMVGGFLGGGGTGCAGARGVTGAAAAILEEVGEEAFPRGGTGDDGSGRPRRSDRTLIGSPPTLASRAFVSNLIGMQAGPGDPVPQVPRGTRTDSEDSKGTRCGLKPTP